MAASDTRTCIYCLEDKRSSEFNREHVVNQAFGTFEGNLVLDCVCRPCNSFFGRELDEILACDSMEGLDRYRHGLKSTAKYRSLGRRTRHEVEVQGGGYLNGAIGRHVADPQGGACLALDFEPQVGFGPTPQGPFIWFRLDALPTKADLTRMGYPPGTTFSMRIQGTPLQSAQAALAAAGLPSGPIEEIPPPSGSIRAETRCVIGDVDFRAVSKVAFNYLAFMLGAHIARMPHFNEARRYIRYGTEPPRAIVAHAEESPVTVSMGADGRDVPGHYVTLTHDRYVVAQVSLFCRLRYTIDLAVDPFLIGRFASSAHFFDLEHRRVVRLARTIAPRPSPTLPTDSNSPSSEPGQVR